MHDPNDGATIASDISNPRYYSSDSQGIERRALHGWEERGGNRKKDTRFSGEMSVGVSSRF
ncbi:hypothetical protein NT6N_06770 [Oceaniferula spumae]|uniref:Uncharacterized protein n=1 Tax=Oceaniferula spumae TaxID=2979115 RepID=A0AAT9FI47_9BACT